MFQFGNIEYLHLLWIIPVLFALFILTRVWNRKKLQSVFSLSIISRLAPMYSKRKLVAKTIIMLLALSAIIIVIARPRFGTKLKEVDKKGKELVIALDVSRSMLATDIAPNRLEQSKRAIIKLLGRLKNDRISLIVFAGDAFTQLPLTTDYPAAKMFIESVSTDMIPTQGTAIGTAIDQALNSFSPGDAKNKAIIVISDGENHEGKAIEMAKEAAEKGVKVYTIGMGLAKGVPIPVPGRTNEFHKDRNGHVVITKLNEGMMQQIAAAGNGAYIRANNVRSGLNSLFDEIDKLENVKMKTTVYDEYDEQFQVFAWLAFLLLIIEFLMLERKNKLFSNINLFNKVEK